MNVSEVKQLEDGAWVNQVTGRISSAKNMQTKTGKDMGVAKLGDDNATVDLTSFDKTFMSYDGKTVEISGKGIKKDSYNGYDKLMVGKGAKITVLDAPAQPASAPAPAQQTLTPSGESFEDAFLRRLRTGYQIAIDLEANADGHIELSGEDKRAIAISFQIAAERAGK